MKTSARVLHSPHDDAPVQQRERLRPRRQPLAERLTVGRVEHFDERRGRRHVLGRALVVVDPRAAVGDQAHDLGGRNWVRVRVPRPVRKSSRELTYSAPASAGTGPSTRFLQAGSSSRAPLVGQRAVGPANQLAVALLGEDGVSVRDGVLLAEAQRPIDFRNDAVDRGQLRDRGVLAGADDPLARPEHHDDQCGTAGEPPPQLLRRAARTSRVSSSTGAWASSPSSSSTACIPCPLMPGRYRGRTRHVARIADETRTVSRSWIPAREHLDCGGGVPTSARRRPKAQSPLR